MLDDAEDRYENRVDGPVKSVLAQEIVLLHKLFPHYTGRQLARQLGVSHQHVYRVLARQGQENGGT